jgi:hypothetical protein
MAFPAAGLAQEQHAVELATLAQTIERHAIDQDARRASIREALARPEVRGMASRMGIDLDQFQASLPTLADGDLDHAAVAARDVNDAFAGGSSVTLSVTTIIIILLIVILLIVLLK